MRYDVVIIPESFHKFDKHTFQHVCVPMVIGDRSYDIAMEILNGIDRGLRSRFSVTVENVEGDDCDLSYRRYTVEKDGKKVTVHAKPRRIGKGCHPIEGNRLSVLEFERDIDEIISEIEKCMA